MAEKQKPLSDEAVLTLVEEKVRRSVGWFDSKLSVERERVIKYYNLQLPKRQSEGRSSYISSDVYDGVESMKSQLLETFAGNPDNLVSFPPKGDEDIQMAGVATDEANHQVWELNDGYGICRSIIHDGLTARAGIVKVYWEQKKEEVEEEFTGPYQDILALANRDDVKGLDADADEATGLFKGKLTRMVDRSQVRIAALPPEEFLVEEQAVTVEEAGLTSHRTLKVKAELKKEGYDPKKVDSIAWADARSLDLTPERLERNRPVSNGIMSMDDAVQTDMQKVMLYETFIKMDMQDGRGVRLWKVCHAGHVLLDKEEVDRAPFKVFVPLPTPHTFYGNNFAARIIPTQNARTALTRAILDHASVTTNPRWGVVKGGLLNPKEMLDNRLGGIVNLNRPDAVNPLQYQPLNPFIFQTLEMLKQNKEESTGISSLSQGLNKDAVSNQNSQGLVADLVTLSQGRQKIVARNFAYGFLIGVYLEVYRLILENKGGDVESWIERKDVRVALHLGYGEKDRQVAKMRVLYKDLASDPAMAPGFSYQNRYALAMDTMKTDGSFANYAKYLTPPEQVQPPGPDPIQMAEAKAKQDTAQAALLTAQATQVKNEKQAEVSAMSEMLKEMKLHIESIFKAREQDRQDADTANRIDVAQREIKLAEEAPQADQNVIVSANS